MIYIMIVLNLLLAGFCWYKKLNYSAIYLAILGFSDILHLILRCFYLGSATPYIGGALIAFTIKNFILVLVPVLLMKLIYRSTSADSGYLPELLATSASIFSIYMYPAIRGASLILRFNLFYILIDLFCAGIILNYFTKVKGNKDQLILLICSFGGAMSFILSIIFGNWIVITTCNFLYYLAILWLILTKRYASPEFLQDS